MSQDFSIFAGAAEYSNVWREMNESTAGRFPVMNVVTTQFSSRVRFLSRPSGIYNQKANRCCRDHDVLFLTGVFPINRTALTKSVSFLARGNSPCIAFVAGLSPRRIASSLAYNTVGHTGPTEALTFR